MVAAPTAGEKKAIQKQAAPVVASASVSVCVPDETFTVVFRGQHIELRRGVRFMADPELKTVLQGTDRAITWES
jgi:hypothetical protein